MKLRSPIQAAWVALALAGALPALAQMATGNIRGTVVDSTDAALPNASVSIIHAATGLRRTVAANEQGDYSAPLMPTGEYRIVAQAEGFQQKVISGIQLQVDQTAVIRILLDPGAITQTIEVTTATPLLESQTSSLGQVIENRRIVDLPLNGRNPFLLGLLAGGTVPFRNLGTNLPIAAGGGRHSGNDVLLDGVDNNLRYFAGSVGRNGINYTPSVDAVQEFKVKTSSFAAEYGRSAGFTMSATLKSGGNQFHGSAWEFLRNDKLDANNFTSNFAAQAKPKFRQNQFGATFGGPVRLPGYNGRDRTFFFGDYEGLQVREAATSALSDVPPAAFRQGDFSRSSRILHDPGSRRLGPNGVVTATPFPRNQIPSSLLDPVSVKYQELFPVANVGGPDSESRNYLTTSPRETRRNQGDVKIDHRFSDSNTLMGRVSLARASQPDQGLFVFSASDQLYNTVNAVLANTHVFGPSLVHDFRFGYNRANTSRLALRAEDGIAFAGQNGLHSGPVIGLPRVSFQFSGQGFGQTQFTAFNASSSNLSFENLFHWTDNLTVIRGNHTWKTGIEVRRFRFDRIRDFPASAGYVFGAIFTANPSLAQDSGLPYADFLLGVPSSVTGSFPLDWSRIRDLYVSPFVQDDWRITRRLTLNLGLRYDLFTQPVDALDTGGVFDPHGLSRTGRRGIIRRPGRDGNSRAVVEGHHLNFAPRFGLAYQATPKFVVRAGYGIFYSQREQNDEVTDIAATLLNFRVVTTPQVIRETTVAPPMRFNSPLRIDSRIDPEFSQYSGANPLAGDANNNNAADIGNSRFPMLQQFNLSLQYEWKPGLLVETSYSGARGLHWVQRVDVNQVRFEDALAGRNRQQDRPFPFLQASTGIDTANVNNWYHAFNLRVERTFSSGFSLLANYTISKNTESGNMGSATYTNGANTRPLDSYNLRLERGVSPLDVPQKLAVSAVYELPFGAGKPLLSSGGLASLLFGGWQVNGILLLRSGYPTDVLVTRLPPVFGTINRPDRVLGEPLLVDNPGFDQYFNPKAFRVSPTVPDFRGAPVQTFGNSGRMPLRGPGSANLDLSLFKDIRISETSRLQFRAEAFNFTNTPTFELPRPRSPVLTVGNAAFGKLTGSQTVGRQVQFGLKYIW